MCKTCKLQHIQHVRNETCCLEMLSSHYALARTPRLSRSPMGSSCSTAATAAGIRSFTAAMKQSARVMTKLAAEMESIINAGATGRQ